MSAPQDLQDLLARAHEIAGTSKISGLATLAGPDRENSPVSGWQKPGLPLANPANPLIGSQKQADRTPEEWTYRFHERAGFLEHDCHMSRHDAEQWALHELQGHWLALHPMPAGTPEGGCVQCGGDAGAIDLLPHLAAGRGHFWIHSRCWPEFERARCAEALAALRRLVPDLPDAGGDALDGLLADLSQSDPKAGTR